jgi:hypothetical protein
MQLDSADKRFGDIELDYDLSQALADNETFYIEGEQYKARDIFVKLSDSEVSAFRAAGAAAEYDDEILYETSQKIPLLDAYCDCMISTHNGKIFKVALTYAGSKEQTLGLQELNERWFTQFLGQPQRLSGKMLLWDTPYSRIRVNVRSRLFPKFSQFQLIARQK